MEGRLLGNRQAELSAPELLAALLLFVLRRRLRIAVILGPPVSPFAHLAALLVNPNLVLKIASAAQRGRAHFFSSSRFSPAKSLRLPRAAVARSISPMGSWA